MACYLVRVMKRSIAASERQFAEALPSSHSRADVGAHAIGSPYPHYVWEGYPKQRTASIFIVDAPAVFAIRSTDLAMASLVTKSQRPIAGTRNRRGLVERPGTRPR